MLKLLYWIVGIAVVIQFIRPDFNNPKVDKNTTLSTDAPTMAVLKTSCYDCHSNETKYPWYHNVAPVSWVMSENIEDGRKALNFSTWANIAPDIKLKRLERAKQLIERGVMPKSEYCLIHKDAVLTSTQKATLEQFFDAEIKKLPAH
jgi:hypothetical protein